MNSSTVRGSFMTQRTGIMFSCNLHHLCCRREPFSVRCSDVLEPCFDGLGCETKFARYRYSSADFLVLVLVFFALFIVWAFKLSIFFNTSFSRRRLIHASCVEVQ